MKKGKKLKTTSQLKHELDKIFSRYIRQRDKGICFTCGLQKTPKEMQNGHFVPRQYLAMRWDESNCACQCYACNMLYNGQPSVFAIKLTEKYGQDHVRVLENRRKQIIKDYPYEEKIEEYTQKLKELSTLT